MLSATTTRTLIGVGIGALAVGGAAAWLATRGHDHADGALSGDGNSFRYDDAPPGPEGSMKGPGNLAVAWWPQDIHLEQDGSDATLRFQSTVANIGTQPVQLRDGDRLEYTVRREDAKGIAGEVVGHGSLPLTRADVQKFPVEEGGHGVGHDLDELGVTLKPISLLEPATAAVVGSQHPEQAISIHDATAGMYQLTQQIVRADGSVDPVSYDDARITEFILDGQGGILHTASRYAGRAD